MLNTSASLATTGLGVCLSPIATLIGVHSLNTVQTSQEAPWFKVIELGVGGLIVTLITVPLVRWIIGRLDRQGDQNDKLLQQNATMLQQLVQSTRSNEAAIAAFKEFESSEDHIHSEILKGLERLAQVITSLEAKIDGCTNNNKRRHP